MLSCVVVASLELLQAPQSLGHVIHVTLRMRVNPLAVYSTCMHGCLEATLTSVPGAIMDGIHCVIYLVRAHLHKSLHMVGWDSSIRQLRRPRRLVQLGTMM